MTVQKEPLKWKKLLPHGPLVKRDEYILKRCVGKNVLHLGACDAPFTLEKASRGELLHQKLQGVCSGLIGYDIDASSVELLKTRFGINNIVIQDLSSLKKCLEQKAKLIICADIIEHVNDAGGLLASCNRMMSIGGIILISTVNALSFKHALRSLITRIEIVHPDHVSYYSYATLGVLLGHFGFKLTVGRFFVYPTGNNVGELLDKVFKVFPHSANGIIVEAEKVRDV